MNSRPDSAPTEGWFEAMGKLVDATQRAAARQTMIGIVPSLTDRELTRLERAYSQHPTHIVTRLVSRIRLQEFQLEMQRERERRMHFLALSVIAVLIALLVAQGLGL